jgi:signal peptidase I
VTPPAEDPGRALASSEQPPADDTLQVAAWPRKSVAREYLEAVLIALALAVVIRTFFIQAYMIPSGSMEPTLLIGDHILVSKVAYGIRLPDSIFGVHLVGLPLGRYLVHFGNIHRGDVIVFVHPQERDKDLIKRVIGLPGDKVQIKTGRVWLNGSPINDPHAHLEVPDGQRFEVPRDNFGFMDASGAIVGPLEVPAGRLFVMGDNRDHSEDSRYWGFADQNDVEGRALVIYWSRDGDASGLLPIRWSRFGRSLSE